MHVNYTETDDEDIVAPKAKQRKQIGKHPTYIHLIAVTLS